MFVIKRSSLTLATLLALSTAAFSPIAAQISAVPSAMNFQGRLATPSGNPVPDGTYSIRFSLHDAVTAGTEKYSKTVANVQVKNGTFAVTLDAFPAGTFNGNLWLEVKIGSNTPLAPRTPLVSVPYAIKSDLALTVPDGSITVSKFAANIFNPLAWLLGGNNGVTSGFLGTTDNNPLEFRVNGRRAMRYSYAENTANQYRSINVLGGSEINSISAGVVGATLAGGGQDYFTANDFPNRVTADFGTVGGGVSNLASGQYATVAGGFVNTASGLYAAVLGGFFNTASNDYSTVAGGYSHIASGQHSTVSGGDNNSASGRSSTIGGGYNNTASSDYSTIAGGFDNTASGNGATVGGVVNIASAYASTVPGGSSNTAAGINSFAAGYRAKANHAGTFVWADNRDTNADFSSTAANQFNVLASGGVRIYTNSAATIGVTLTASDSSWNSVSDRNAKTDFGIVDTLDILERLVAIPITTWNYKGVENPIRHIGPMAQDFWAAFKVGMDDKHIGTIDADGVALAAIQGLNRKLELSNAVIKKENAALKAKNTELEARLDALVEAVAKLQTQPK